jgi:nicotinamide-nucleotide amidase
VVIPDLLSRYKTLPVLRQRILKLYGITEPQVAEAIKDITAKRKDVLFGFYPHFPENHITISLRGTDEASVIQKLDSVEREIRDVLGSYIFATGNESMESVIGTMLKDQKLTLSVAESCTGGLIGNLITDVPGSSSYFMGGVVVYSNMAKEKILGVNPETLKLKGAVSDQTAIEMADGVRRLLRSDMGIAVTGIAGPDGGTKEKPVGTVHIAMSVGENLVSKRYRFWGTREQIKRNTAMMALDWIRRYLNGDPFLPGI